MLLLDRADQARALAFSELKNLKLPSSLTADEIAAAVDQAATCYGGADGLFDMQLAAYCSPALDGHLVRMKCACALLAAVFPDGVPAD